MSDKTLPDKIMDLLKEEAEKNNEYINPHFLSELSGLLDDYCQLGDKNVDKWIKNMWSW